MERLGLYLLFLSLYRSNADLIPTTPQAVNITTEKEEEIFGETRRILGGKEITDTRPYMVFLRPTQSHGHAVDTNWLCGGVIIDESYILTSAACIEDIKYFYVVSGTHRWLPVSETNECIDNGAFRATWKCVARTTCSSTRSSGPRSAMIYWDRSIITDSTIVANKPDILLIHRSQCRAVLVDIAILHNENLVKAKKDKSTYRFDGHVFNNIRWMVNDIAVVMIEGSISFSKRVKGCDFIPAKVDYNNITKELERPGTKGFIAGWGSIDKYTDAADILARTSVNSPNLMETETVIITKDSCQLQWLDRYHTVIEYYMICGKVTKTVEMSKSCNENHVECRQLIFSEEEGPRVRRFESNPDKLLLNSAGTVRKREKARKHTRRHMMIRDEKKRFGGFCENDHGGPFIVGRGNSAIVVGIMSAYRVENNSKQCYGPFLYTSVYNNRHLIHCALHKTEGNDCASVMRDQSSVLEEEAFDWGDIPIRQRAIYEDDETPSEPERAPTPDIGTVAIPEHKDTSTSNAHSPKQRAIYEDDETPSEPERAPTPDIGTVAIPEHKDTSTSNAHSPKQRTIYEEDETPSEPKRSPTPDNGTVATPGHTDTSLSNAQSPK